MVSRGWRALGSEPQPVLCKRRQRRWLAAGVLASCCLLPRVLLHTLAIVLGSWASSPPQAGRTSPLAQGQGRPAQLQQAGGQVVDAEHGCLLAWLKGWERRCRLA